MSEVKHYRLDFLYRNGEAEADMKACEPSRFSYVKSTDFDAQAKRIEDLNEENKRLRELNQKFREALEKVTATNGWSDQDVSIKNKALSEGGGK